MASNTDAASDLAALSPDPHNPTNASDPTPTEDKGYKIRNDRELRIVMVGKTGAGKSATGNTILGQESFLSRLSASSLTEKCSKRRGVVDGQHVALIDTPGLFDTRFGQEKTVEDISQCITYASPGPHVFLVVIRLGRYTEEEKETVQKIQEIFGPAADKYSMVLFTGGDCLDRRTIKEFLLESPDLEELVDRCNGQYHVFNNKLKNRSQITELLTKIRRIVQKNGRSHYTTEMFQEAEMIIQQEKLRILEEKEAQIIKEKQELKKQMKEKIQKEIEEMNKKFELERKREKKERDEEKRREEERRNEERDKERKEREEMVREMQKMKEEREFEKEKRDSERKEREEMEREMQKMKEEREFEKEERERERKEREEEERREMEKREAEKERERKQMEENLKKTYEDELERDINKVQTSHEEKARKEAEDSNPIAHLLMEVAGAVLASALPMVTKGIVWVGRSIISWF